MLCDPLQTTHDSMGLVYDWVSELKFTVDKNLLDYLRDTHHIDVNPQNGEFTFDLECNAEQVIVWCISMYIDVRRTLVIIVLTSRARTGRTTASGPTPGSPSGGPTTRTSPPPMSWACTVSSQQGLDNYCDAQPVFIATVGIPLGILFLLLIVGTVVLTVFAKSTGRWCFADDDYQYRDPQSNKRPPTHAQVYRFTLNPFSYLLLVFVSPPVYDNFLNIFPVSAMMVRTKGSPKPTQVTLLQTVLKSHQGPALENK